MKPYKILFLLFSFTLIAMACTRRVVVHKRTTVVKPMPPGHAKKVYGSQSAKPYAPGQRKKRVRGY
ncbi:hypothetical protein [Terrimonas alba]|uniref:hypothetical protein n=1 Tax=Terrimonas alba TaxID=3349636 RepID=UPI0035F292BF